MSESGLPAIGTTVVHKDDHKLSKGPVWQVTRINKDDHKPIRIDHAGGHKLNKGLDSETRRLTAQEFDSDYKQL
jgi:hypothetical protein